MTDEKPGVYSAKWTRKNAEGNDESVSGSLEITDGSPSHLIHLTGDFADQGGGDPAFFSGAAEADVYPVIHGETQNGFYTAIDSRPGASSRRFGGGLSDIVLLPSFMIKGSMLLHEHELEVTEVSLRIWDQDAWADWYNFQIDNSGADVVVTQKAMPKHSVRIGNVVISLEDISDRFYFPYSGKLTLNQRSTFHLTFDEAIPLRDFMAQWMRPLGFWISSGTRRTSGVDSMSIRNKNWVSDLDGSPMETWLEVIPRNPKGGKVEGEIDFLHQFKHFNFAKQLPLVLDTFKKHQTAIDQFLDYTHTTPATAMIQLTTFAQIVETFDRSLSPDIEMTDAQKAAMDSLGKLMSDDPALKKYTSKAVQGIAESHRLTLAHRLSRLDKETGNLVSSEIQRPDWKSEVANIRNSAVHGLPSSALFGTNIIPLQVSVSFLRVLFEARLLVAMGFTPEQVKQMITQYDLRWMLKKSMITSYLDSFDTFKNFKP